MVIVVRHMMWQGPIVTRPNSDKAQFILQELEKFKFVLDYKIKELKRQIEPKEEQITDMKDQVKVAFGSC